MSDLNSPKSPLSGLSHRSETVLALDLEGTLISNAVSCIPRPGLFDFLEFCRGRFRRIVLYTFVPRVHVDRVLAALADEGSIPDWFLDVEWVKGEGGCKDLRNIKRAVIDDIIIIDDNDVFHPSQKSQWLRIPCFDYPYPPSDREFHKIIEALR